MILFTPELMFRFVSERFEGTSSVIQEQALSWLQVNKTNIWINLIIIFLLFY